MIKRLKAGLAPALFFQENSMNKRLHAIVKYIEAGKGLIDVGTDHGYLPAWMACHGYKGNIIASDVNTGPLQKAMATAEKAGLSGKIQFQLSDGLESCPPDAVDTIIIAGMGGELICRILDRAEWCMDRRYKLILQPMTKAEVLRYWLVNNEFEICAEDLIADAGNIYQLMVVRFGGVTRLSDAELFTGKKELCADIELFRQQRIRLISRFEKALSGMEKNNSKRPSVYKLYSDILSELKGE